MATSTMSDFNPMSPTLQPFPDMGMSEMAEYYRSAIEDQRRRAQDYQRQAQYMQQFAMESPRYYPGESWRDAGNSLALHSDPEPQDKPFDKIEDLSKHRRGEILQVLEFEYLNYRLQIKIKNMTTGIKWFLICLGLAVLMNFDKLLNLFALIVKR